MTPLIRPGQFAATTFQHRRNMPHIVLAKSTPKHAAPIREACAHHWHIAPPDGPTSPGVCIVCGAVREFRNANWDGVVFGKLKRQANGKV